MADLKYEKCDSCCELGQPMWMGTFADMMTLLFAFFVLMFSMATMDPVKASGLEGDGVGGMTDEDGEKIGGGKSEQEIKEEIKEFKEAGVTEIKGIPIDEYEEQLLEQLDKKIKKSLYTIMNEMQEIVEEMNIEDSALVSSNANGVNMEINGDICFDALSTAMKPGLIELLDRVANEFLLASNDVRPIVIEGHTDNEPIPEKHTDLYPTNWHLSASRASVVTAYLISKGVNPSRLSARGYGYQWPASLTWKDRREGKITQLQIEEQNATVELRTKNRRIKIIIGDTRYM